MTTRYLTRNLVAELVLAAAITATPTGLVLAQTAPGAPPAPPAPPPAVSPAPFPEPLPVPAPDPKAAEEAERQRHADISANYDATLDTYKNIIERQDTDTQPLEKRIEANESLVEDYQPKLQESQQGLRQERVGFVNRMLELKRQRDTGLITEEQFQKLAKDEETRFAKHSGRYRDEATFYSDESMAAKTRVKTLAVEKEKKEREVALRKGSEPGKADPTAKAYQGIYGTLDKVSGFRTRFTMDGVAGLWRYDYLHQSATK